MTEHFNEKRLHALEDVLSYTRVLRHDLQKYAAQQIGLPIARYREIESGIRVKISSENFESLASYVGCDGQTFSRHLDAIVAEQEDAANMLGYNLRHIGDKRTTTHGGHLSLSRSYEFSPDSVYYQNDGWKTIWVNSAELPFASIGILYASGEKLQQDGKMADLARLATAPLRKAMTLYAATHVAAEAATS